MFCDLYKHIPYDDLNEFHLPTSWLRYQPYEGIIIFEDPFLKVAVTQDFGYCHHQDLESLQSSAKACELCSVVLKP
jgi:hypothetical protein